MKTIISAIIVAGALSQMANAMAPAGDTSRRHFYKDQEWIWQTEKSKTAVSGTESSPQKFSEINAWQAALRLSGALSPSLGSTPILAFGLPTHPPANLAFGLPTHPPANLAFGLPTHPPANLAFGLPTHPPATLAFGLPTHPPATLAFGLPTHPPATLAFGLPTHPPATLAFGLPTLGLLAQRD
jgi:hypothetical protein